MTRLKLSASSMQGTRAASSSSRSERSRANHMKLRRIFKWSTRVILAALVLGFLVGFIAYWASTNDCDRKTALVNPMKAIVHCEYGSPDVLKLEDVEKPVPNDDQVLIKVRAASLNALDAYMIRDAWLNRLIFGLRKPRD